MNRVDLLSTHLAGRLAGKVALITGAGSGIGRATALTFAREGAKLVCVDWNEEGAKETAQLVVKAGGQAIAVGADAGDEVQTTAAFEKAIATFGKLNVVFANAGVSGVPVHFVDLTVDNFESTFRTNVIGVFLCIKLATLQFKKQQNGGSIIATASVAGIRSGAGGTDYSASKAAVISLVQTCANQLAGSGIRVNAVCPGLIETGMTQPVFDMARERGTSHKLGQLNPLRRTGTPQEIANAVLFLASDEGSYVNGQALAVCGGLSSSHPVVPGKIA